MVQLNNNFKLESEAVPRIVDYLGSPLWTAWATNDMRVFGVF
jgi:hypothetical protein